MSSQYNILEQLHFIDIDIDIVIDIDILLHSDIHNRCGALMVKLDYGIHFYKIMLVLYSISKESFRLIIRIRAATRCVLLGYQEGGGR